MILILEVVGPQAANLGHAARKTFTAAGGTIGRSNDNDWIIANSYISGTHARIHFRNNRFFVVDSSANGTSLKSRANRLTRGQWYALSDMDRLFLDTVEIRVSVDNPAKTLTAPVAADPLATQTAVLASPSPSPSSQPATANADQPTLSPRTTPLAMPSDAVLAVLLGDRDLSSFEREFLNSPLPAEEAFTQALDRHSVADAPPVFERTTVLTPGKTPEHTTMLTSSMLASQENSLSNTAQHQKITLDARYADIFNSAPLATPAPATQQLVASPAAAPQPTAKQVAAAANPVDQYLDTQRVKSLLLSGMDIPAEAATPELTDTLTQILRECIQGLLELQQQREAMKDTFRLSVTKFKAAENNPLRFSANVEDALYNLLVKRNPAYLQPAAAVTSSFKDAQRHQSAMQHAISTAFCSMMQQFDPRHFDSADSKRWSLFGNEENASWQQYNREYTALRKQADGGFAALFGSAFAHAYQEELDRLRQPNN